MLSNTRFDYISVSGDHRGKGYGSALVNDIEARAKSSDKEGVTVWVLEDNEDLVRFYEKRDYQVPDNAERDDYGYVKMNKLFK